MWLILAVLFLLGTTQVIGGFSDHVLPPLARWGWWTANMYAVGVASLGHPFGDTSWKLVGIAFLTIFYASIPFMWADYLAVMPTKPETLHWPTVFAVVNIIIPVGLAAAGPMVPVIRTDRG